MGEGRSRPGGWRFTDGVREFRLFPEQRRFFNGDEEIILKARAFDLLVLLLRNAGQIVSKKQIVAEVWRNYDVTDGLISGRISAIRRAIGRDVVATINNQGYQFTCPVEVIEVPVLPARPVEALSGLPHLTAVGVGREEELEQLAALVGQHRLVTIMGPGGIGKTWLATALGQRLAPSFPDGVYFADLTPAKDATSLAATIAQELRIALRSSDDPVRIIGGTIDKRKALLILDGCEYLAEAVRAMVAGLLELAPNLSVLTTSQAALKHSKEGIFRLKPLGLDDAVTLFIESARAVDGNFEADGQNAGAVAEICRRLDGLPLSIEMAAAAAPFLGITAVLAGLDERFDMLDSAPRHGEERHATLTAVMEWSHGLLDEADKEVFRRLSIFAGSFTAEAAAAVAWEGTAGKWRAPISLGRMADKSLLVLQDGDPPRFRMLETIGLYAGARLVESGECDRVAERHARYYTALFEKADEVWETMPDADWTAIYGPDIGNARAALDWALAVPEQRVIAIALGGAVAPLWERLDLSVEGRAYMDRIVSLIDEALPSAEAARLLKGAGMLWRRTDRARAVTLAERSAALYRRIGNRLALGSSLGFVGGDYVFLGRYAEAKPVLDEAGEVLGGGSYVKSLLRLANDFGMLAELENRYDDALRHFGIARDLARKLNDAVRENFVLINLADLEFHAGATERAIEYAREAASSLRSIHQHTYLGWVLVNLACYLILQNKNTEARANAVEALSFVRMEGGQWLRFCLQLWALLGTRAGHYAEAAQLQGFVDVGYARSGNVREPLEQRIYDEVSRLLAANCAAPDARAWAAEGARWEEARAADFAFRRLVSPGS